MMDERERKIQRIKELAKDTNHIRMNALMQAGILLQGCEREVTDSILSSLEEGIIEDDEFYDAYCELASAIVQEVENIGRDLTARARSEGTAP